MLGECVVFDNLRVLHGRKGFGFRENGERTIQGGYVDWDEVRSKINILKLVLGKEGIEEHSLSCKEYGLEY